MTDRGPEAGDIVGHSWTAVAFGLDNGEAPTFVHGVRSENRGLGEDGALFPLVYEAMHGHAVPQAKLADQSLDGGQSISRPSNVQPDVREFFA